MTEFIIICEGLSLAKCEKKDVREINSQNLLLFLTSWNFLPEDNIPINKGLKNPVMETFFDMTFANPVNSRLHHIKFSNSLDGCNC